MIRDEDELIKLNRHESILETSPVKVVEGDCSIRVEDGYPAPIDYEQLGKEQDFIKQIMDDILTVA